MAAIALSQTQAGAAVTFLERACRAFDDAGVDYAVVGGQAVALHGVVRGTLDLDVVLRWEPEVVGAAEAALRKMGLVSRLPITAVHVVANRDRYIKERNLMAWTFYNPEVPLEEVDIIISYDLAGKPVSRVAVGGGSVAVLSAAALIEMKRASGRPQDLEDARALEKLR